MLGRHVAAGPKLLRMRYRHCRQSGYTIKGRAGFDYSHFELGLTKPSTI